MRERSLTARTDATANCYACVAVELSRLLSLHISSTSQLTDAHRSLPYQNNWAYGPPKTHLFADAILSPTAPPPSPPAAMPAPAGFMADLFPVEPVPFAAWHDLGRTRRLLDTARPMPHPTPRIIGAGLRLPKYTAERTIWRQIKGLNATPQMRNTLHRLVFGHIPKRQDRDTSDLCACGAPETVAHLTGKCWAFAPLRAQFTDAWLLFARFLAGQIMAEFAQSAAALDVALATATATTPTPTQPAGSTPSPSTQPPAPSSTQRPARPTATPDVRSMLPAAWPELDTFVVLPLLQWAAFNGQPGVISPSAEAFKQLYQLAASTFIHLLWVARNDHAYSQVRWTHHRFAIAFNRDFTNYAHATLPSSSPLLRLLPMLLLQVHDQLPDPRPSLTLEVDHTIYDPRPP
ncbi:hypothetical protein LPJ73_000207 [Coemansia sp. RSA 2703]|nr:hypothetical protein LPJ73_000207 [Coemansia sp. RSA 2703]